MAPQREASKMKAMGLYVENLSIRSHQRPDIKVCDDGKDFLLVEMTVGLSFRASEATRNLS